MAVDWAHRSVTVASSAWVQKVFALCGTVSDRLVDNSNFLLKIIPEFSLNFENSYLLNRNSDRKSLHMKNDQLDETNPNMHHLFSCLITLSASTWNFWPLSIE